MTEHQAAFDHRPDAELGAALRRALDPADPSDTPAFAARVLAGFDAARVPAALPWEVLAGWSGRGIAAAALAALLAGLLLIRAPAAAMGVEEGFVSPAEGGATTALLAGQQAPDASVVFATLVER